MCLCSLCIDEYVIKYNYIHNNNNYYYYYYYYYVRVWCTLTIDGNICTITHKHTIAAVGCNYLHENVHYGDYVNKLM